MQPCRKDTSLQTLPFSQIGAALVLLFLTTVGGIYASGKKRRKLLTVLLLHSDIDGKMRPQTIPRHPGIPATSNRLFGFSSPTGAPPQSERFLSWAVNRREPGSFVVAILPEQPSLTN